MTFFRLVLFMVCMAMAQDLFLDRPYNLALPNSQPLLQTLHHQTQSGRLESHYPRRDSSWRQHLSSSPFYSYRSSRSFLSVQGILGYNYRGAEALNDTAQVFEGGLLLKGFKDSVEFWLDARIYNESHSLSDLHQANSWDREFLEIQDKDINGALSYASYARYRGHITYHTYWARFDAGRDAVHWGPGYWNNLTLNQNAVPFPQFSMETQIGPLTVKSLYGDLLISNFSMSDSNARDRHLYGHRYELLLHPQWLLGVSEITILDSLNEPIHFVPIVPLFMQKGQMAESYNNGAISLDLTWRYPGVARIYGELLLDDLESPISLIKNDNAEAKWGAMLGAHLIYEISNWQTGFIAEYSRVEPWVYTHFQANTAQIAHQEFPLGNPLGPNSQAVDVQIYGNWKLKLLTAIRLHGEWKGTDPGSDLNDETPKQHHSYPKSFLQGAHAQWTLKPSVAWNGQYIHSRIELGLGDNPSFDCRLGLLW